MLFNYEAIKKTGEKVFGTIESETKEEAVLNLHKQDLIIININPIKSTTKIHIKEEELILFTRLLSTAVASSIPLTRALEITSSEVSEKSMLKIIISSLLHEIKIGKSLSDALSLYRHIFTDIYINMVKAGEKSGKLSQSLQDVLKYLQKRYEMKKKISTALLYPTMIIVFAIIILLFFIFGLIPKFQENYTQFSGEMPFITKVLMDSTNWIKNNFIFILLFIIIISIIINQYKKTEKGRKFFEQIIFALPIIGNLYLKDIISRMTKTISVLITNGVPLIDAMELTQGIVNNSHFEEIIQNGIRELTQGRRLTEALKNQKYIPSILIQISAMGEESGRLGELMGNISEFYEKDVDNSIEKITSLITPIMIVFIGVIIGFIVIALFLPIMNITQMIK